MSCDFFVSLSRKKEKTTDALGAGFFVFIARKIVEQASTGQSMHKWPTNPRRHLLQVLPRHDFALPP